MQPKIQGRRLLKKTILLIVILLTSFLIVSVPIARADDTNLAPMFQSATVRWGDYHLYDVLISEAPAQLERDPDTSVLHNGHWSIKIDGDGFDEEDNSDGSRCIDEQFYGVQVGDRVVFRCWIKAAYSSFGSGGIIGFDFHGAYGRISECHPRTNQTAIWDVDGEGYPIDEEMNGSPIYIPYDTLEWTLLTLDVTIPTTFFTGDVDHTTFPQPTQISSIGLWITASWNQHETAAVWFADAELYINPTVLPTPTPAPESSSTPTISPYDPEAPTFLDTTIFGMNSSLLFLCVGGIVGAYIVTQTVRGKRYD